jgi:hypothetical protein
MVEFAAMMGMTIGSAISRTVNLRKNGQMDQKGFNQVYVWQAEDFIVIPF